MRGRPCTQPFLVESLSGSRQSPQRNFSPAPLGKSIAPSSVTFGDSFPPRGSLWVVQPYTKKRPKSGHVHGHRNSPSTGTMWHPTPKRASGNERPLNRGGGGHPPATLCVRAFSRESLDPPPGTGREPTSQVLTCDGPNRTTCRRQTRPPAPRLEPSPNRKRPLWHAAKEVVLFLSAGTHAPSTRARYASAGRTWPTADREAWSHWKRSRARAITSSRVTAS